MYTLTLSLYCTVPSAVRNVSIAHIRANSFHLKWQPPKFANGQLRAYHVQVKHSRRLYEAPSWCGPRASDVRKNSLSPDLLSYEVEKLDPFEEYLVSISAATSVGHGPASEVTATTLPTGETVHLNLPIVFSEYL